MISKGTCETGSSCCHSIVARIVLAVYLIGSVAYIGYDLWSHFAATQLTAAYQSGQESAVQQLIAKSAECKPITVFAGEGEAKKEVSLMPQGCEEKK